MAQETSTAQEFVVSLDAALLRCLGDPIEDFGEPEAVSGLLRDMVTDGLLVRGCLRDWERGLDLISVRPREA
jgi:hypothetical protein